MIYAFNANEIIQMAIDVEKNGLTFYELAQDKVEDPEVREIFKFLAGEERHHIEDFESLKATLPESAKEGTVWDPHHEMAEYLQMMADMHVFKTSNSSERYLEHVENAKDALNMAIQFEKDSILFYLAMEEAVEDESSRRKVAQLVKQEQQHLKKLSLKLRALKG